MYIQTPFNYTGSKYKLLEQLLPLFDYSKNKIIDLFSGGGSIYSNVLDKFDKILVNDIIKDLILIQKMLLINDDIINKVQELCVDKDDKESYMKLRNEYNENKSPEKLWALMLCCTNNMLRFNNKFQFNQTFGRRTFNKNTLKKINDYINNVRPYKDKIIFSHKNFYDIPIVMNSFYYIDPPYGYILNDDGNIGNKQISEAGYNAYYKKEDDIRLYEYVHKINDIGASFLMSGVLEHDNKKSWILTKLINDGFNYQVLDMNYTKVSRKKSDKKTIEIVVYNYNINDNIKNTHIISQDGKSYPVSYFYKSRNKILMNGILLGEYNNNVVVNTIIKQIALSIKNKIKVYKMPPKDVDINKKWFSV